MASEVSAVEDGAGLRPVPATGPALGGFLNSGYGTIGRTVSTKFEPNTSRQFLFWLADRDSGRSDSGYSQGEGALEIGNIVAAQEDDGQDITFGTVVEMRSYSDVDSFIADYLSHNFGDADVQVPTDITQVVVVTCNVMRNLSGETRPLGRSHVYFPSQLGIQFAYGIVNRSGESVFSGAPIPIGVFENGDATVAGVSVDEDFLIGPEGAHLNISGISGLAAKTSSAEFVIQSLLTHTRKRVAVVMFNVKSRDLLYVDQPNPRLAHDAWSQRVYRELALPTSAFVNAEFFAPADPKNPTGTQSRRSLRTQRFTWDLQKIRDDIPTLFDALDWDDKMEGVWYRIREEIDRQPLNSYAQMLAWVDQQISGAVSHNMQWIHGNHIATWNKMRSHLQRFPRAYHGLIAAAGQGADIPWNSLAAGSVYVIDMEMLPDRGKKLVFGRAVREISDFMEKETKQLDAIVVYVDELNKFAPGGSVRTPLKARLIDITARGRSIGLVLFGAEQFASSVEREILENSSTYLFGRTETNELRTPTYSGLSEEVKAKLTTLPQGGLLAKFAKFPQPIFVRFPVSPMSAWGPVSGAGSR